MLEKGDFKVLLWPICIGPFAELENRKCKRLEICTALTFNTHADLFNQHHSQDAEQVHYLQHLPRAFLE